MGKAAIVILNYNGRHYLEKFLPAIIQHTLDHSVYVADNASSDDSLSLIKEKFPTVKTIEFGTNYGFSGGYNRALNQIDATYYVLVNSDIEVTGNWLSPLIRLMDENPGIAACQPKLLDYNRRDYFEYAGAAGGFIDQVGYPFCRGRIFRSVEKDYGQYDDECPVFWVSGACMVVRASDFHEMNGFDEDFFAHMEEIDLCWRFHLAGKKVYYCGKSKVYHVGGGTLNSTNPFKTYLNFRNSFITLIKNSSGSSLTVKIIIRFILDIAAALKFLIFDSSKDFKSVLKADVNIVKKFPRYLKKRRSIRRNIRKPGLIYSRSIVIDHYFLQVKYFFNLPSIIPDSIIPSAKPLPEIHGKS